MDLSATIVIIIGTLLFIGFPVWMALYSRRRRVAIERNDME
jgi:cell division protein FtsX